MVGMMGLLIHTRFLGSLANNNSRAPQIPTSVGNDTNVVDLLVPKSDVGCHKCSQWQLYLASPKVNASSRASVRDVGARITLKRSHPAIVRTRIALSAVVRFLIFC